MLQTMNHDEEACEEYDGGPFDRVQLLLHMMGRSDQEHQNGTPKGYCGNGEKRVMESWMCKKCVDWDDRKTCVLFGDGAGAVAIEATGNENGWTDRKSVV